MIAQGGPERLLLALLFVLAPGCALRPVTVERPDLVDRITGTAASAGADVKHDEGEASADPFVRPVSDVRNEETGAKSEANSIPAESLTLEAARTIALRQSPILAQSQAGVDLARGNLEITDSGFLPTLQGNYGFQAFSSAVGFTGTRGRFPVLPVRGFGPGTQDFHVAEAQLKWTIFQFGKQVAKHDQSELKTEIAKLELERTHQTVFYDVAQCYFRVLEAKSALEIAERSVERSEAFMKESGDLLRRGVITREEHLRAEASLAGVRQEQFDAKSEEEVTVAALNRSMGINVNAPSKVAERREAPRFELSLEQTLSLAVANRREIPVVIRGISVARGDVDIARADFLPSVSIQAGYSNVTGTGIQNANVGAGGIFVTHEIYGGGRRRGQYHAALAGVRSAEAQAQQICDGIAYEVNVAFRGVEDARERIGAARAVFHQAEENFRLVTSRSRAGDATPAELIEAQASETRSEQTLNAAIYQYQRALARLEFAVGVELPLVPGPLPTALPGEAEPGRPPTPPETPSPFLLRSPSTPVPDLLPPLDLGGLTPPPTTTRPTPLRPESSDRPRLFGPPSLARPPYESTSPFGNKP
ncbi:Outer membrane protein TolC [Singulisphaera sp. GP187]|uniref:TolC family protein n=1 Tax=Singulisphaera sp. GP187 TaxID=1882752 RepID=UPI00092A71F3|nr:TolC family protein [Singulisphaera sp. GP187]SIN85406.1 Outer membrane protein TolC [Singulisphaera sp. GP187]